MIMGMPLVQCSIVVAAVRVEAIKWRDSAHPHTQGENLKMMMMMLRMMLMMKTPHVHTHRERT